MDIIDLLQKDDDMASNTSDISRDRFMLEGPLAQEGYDWWWHSLTAHDAITGEERAFYIEFFTINPALGGPEPLFGMTRQGTRDGRRPSYLMVNVGTWGEGAKQMHRFFGWDDVTVGHGTPFWIAADDCVCSEEDLVGHVKVTEEEAAEHPEWMSDAGEVMFDLRVDKRIAFNVGYGASEPIRNTGAFQMFWHAEGVKCLFEGDIVLDGRRYLVDPATCYGYADKNWGSDFTTPWLWLASSDITDRLTGERLDNSAIEIGGGRPKIGPFALDRKLLGELVLEGEPFEFNFSKLWTGSQTSFSFFEGDDLVVWHVEQETFNYRLVTDVTCVKHDMIQIRYESPDGKSRHTRLWNGGTGTGRAQLFCRDGMRWLAIADLDLGHMGCEYGEYDRTTPYE